MTEIQGHHEDGCLMCAVRALTEGRAKEWQTEEPGEVSGVVLRQGEQPSAYGRKPFIELWQGGTDRIRVTAYPQVLESLVVGAEIQVGDTVTIRYTGKQPTRAGHEYKAFELEVRRGHR